MSCFKGFVAKHTSGLEVLSSPDLCGAVNNLDPEAIGKTLEFLRSEYDFVLLDCADLARCECAVCDRRLDPRLPCGDPGDRCDSRSFPATVDNLMQNDYTTEKMDVVINRFSSRFAVSVEQIEKAIRLPIAIRLPNSYMDLVRSGKPW